jgi:hypothetical protein
VCAVADTATKQLLLQVVFLQSSLMKGWKGVDWIHLAQDKDQWQALVTTVMNLRLS